MARIPGGRLFLAPLGLSFDLATYRCAKLNVCNPISAPSLQAGGAWPSVDGEPGKLIA